MSAVGCEQTKHLLTPCSEEDWVKFRRSLTQKIQEKEARSEKSKKRSDALRDTAQLPPNSMRTRCVVNGLLVSCSLETGVGPKIRPGWVDVL